MSENYFCDAFWKLQFWIYAHDVSTIIIYHGWNPNFSFAPSRSDSFNFICFVSSRHDALKGKRVNQTMSDKCYRLKNIVVLSFYKEKTTAWLRSRIWNPKVAGSRPFRPQVVSWWISVRNIGVVCDFEWPTGFLLCSWVFLKPFNVYLLFVLFGPSMALAINVDRRKIKGMYVIDFLATNIQTN